MPLIICPGVHSSQLTDALIAQIQEQSATLPSWWVFAGPNCLPYSPYALLHFLEQALGPAHTVSPLIFLAFSAGVVGAAGAAWPWVQRGGQVSALIAMDGWGVPLSGPWTCHRLSHDYFTHASSSLLGTGSLNFYADPPVSHLDLWQSAASVQGWQVHRQPISPLQRQRTTALSFVMQCIHLAHQSSHNPA